MHGRFISINPAQSTFLPFLLQEQTAVGSDTGKGRVAQHAGSHLGGGGMHTLGGLPPKEHGLTHRKAISDAIYMAHTFCHSLCCRWVLIIQMCIIHHRNTYTAIPSWWWPLVPELCDGVMGSPTWSHGAWTMRVIHESILQISSLSLLQNSILPSVVSRGAQYFSAPWAWAETLI